MSQSSTTPNPSSDSNQEAYRRYFGINDEYLIRYSYDENKPVKNGYVVFIDEQTDIDFIDFTDRKDEEEKKFNSHVALLQRAEASPCKHLPKTQQLEFKIKLATGYVNIISGVYEGIEEIISDALDYLKKRNREHSRLLFLDNGLPAAILAAIAGLILYFCEYRNPWIYGILFGILGAFVSIWTRYGEIKFTGHSRTRLHVWECYSRILIGTIFAVIAMIAIQCGLILPELAPQEKIYSFIIAAFIASFSERFIPSIVERITNENKQ